MYKNKVVAVAIPAYNEERFIVSCIEDLPDFVDHVIVVDDRSSDGTADAVRKVLNDKTHLLVNDHNLGVGGSTIAGYRMALDLGSDIVVKMDGDGQMRSEYLGALLDPLIDDGYNYAKGNRFLNLEALPQMPKLRILGNVALTFLTKMASGYWHVFDPQNGYTAIGAETLRSLDLARIHQRFFFENDMLFQLNLHNARVKDVAIPSKYGDEVSSLSILQVARTFPMLLLRRFLARVMYKYVVRDFSPIALFLMVGLALFSWGFAFGAYSWVRGIITGQFQSTGTVMLSVLPLIMGFQLMLQAIVLDIGESPK